MPVDGVEKDYIKIQYAGSDCLYVPATSLDLVSKYIGGGGEDANVRLNKIGSDAWQKTKAKARKAAKDMAGELIQLYAARKRQPGFAFAACSSLRVKSLNISTTSSRATGSSPPVGSSSSRSLAPILNISQS